MMWARGCRCRTSAAAPSSTIALYRRLHDLQHHHLIRTARYAATSPSSSATTRWHDNPRYERHGRQDDDALSPSYLLWCVMVPVTLEQRRKLYRQHGDLILKADPASSLHTSDEKKKNREVWWSPLTWCRWLGRGLVYTVWLTSETILTAARAIHLLFNFTPLILLAPLVYWRPERFGGRFHTILLWCLERSGPTFIKLGQWASTRPDIFPKDMTDTLTKLHNSVHQHSMDQTWKILEDGFSAHPSRVLLSLDPEPVGSGCIAQVSLTSLCLLLEKDS